MSDLSLPGVRPARSGRAAGLRPVAALALVASLLSPGSAPAVALGAGPVVSSTTLYVGPGGGGGGCATPGFSTTTLGDTTAIENAIAAASSGDVIRLCAHTYDLANSVYVAKPLTFAGDGSTNTTVTQSGSHGLFGVVLASGTATFRDLRLSDGVRSLGGAIRIDGGTLAVERVRFVDNVSEFGGGAIYAQYAPVSIAGSRFEGNSSSQGGAVAATEDVTITGTDFVGNESTSGYGGALYASGGSITGGNVTDNTSSIYGAVSTFAAMTISGTRFLRNHGEAGGAIYAGDDLFIGGATFEGNTAFDGGAIRGAGNLSVTDSTFVANRATEGGGVAVISGDVTVLRSQFTDNTSGSDEVVGYGGAFWLLSGRAVIVKSSFVGNRTSLVGGGVLAYSIAVADSTFVDNSAGGNGGALFGTIVEVTASTFVGNLTGSTYANIYATNSLASRDSLYADGACFPFIDGDGTNLSSDASCPAGQIAPVAREDLRLAAAPALNGATTLSVALEQGSAAIDATGGTCATATDQRGTARPAGVRCDVGAFEYTGARAAVTIATQVSANGSPITGGVPTITTGDLVSDLATVTGTMVDPLGGTFDPTGHVAFHYCRSSVAAVTSCTDGTWTTIESASLTSGDAASDGTSVATLVDWSPPQAGYYLLAASYVPGTGGVYAAGAHTDGTATESFRALASITLAYAGPFLAITDGTTRVALTASASPSGVAEGCSVTFRLEPSGGTGPLSGTFSGGTATASVDLSSGIYQVTVSTGGDCTGGTDTGVLVVGSAGTKGATGGGWYKVPGFSPPKAHFGMTLQVQKRGLVTTTKGQLLWMAKGGGGWRLKASIPETDGTVWVTAACPAGVGDASSKSNPVCGTFGGTGLLQQWDPIAEEWSAYTTVEFRVTAWDGGSIKVCKGNSGKHCTSSDVADWFGISMWRLDGTPITTGDGVPVSGPIRLAVPDGRGSIKAL